MDASSEVGHGFRPTDEEIINHYLRLKNKGEESKVKSIAEVDLCKFEPSELPGLSKIKTNDPEWFFFCSHNQKYPKGHRFNRATKAGYWKATGKERPIKSRSSGMKIGTKKTLVFYKGRAPKGERTAWVIHEYHMNSEKCPYVVCRLFNKDVMDRYSNYDQIEVSGNIPTVARTSPKDIPSNQPMVQSTSESDIITSNVLVPEDRHHSTYVPSDVEDREAEVDPHQEEWLSFLNNLSPLRSEMSTGLGFSHMVSPFASNFGNEHNGMLTQDYNFEVNEICCIHSEPRVPPRRAPSPRVPPPRVRSRIGQSQVEYVRHQMREEIIQENDNEAKPRVVEAPPFLGAMMIMGLISRQNAKDNEAEPKVFKADGEATKHTKTPKVRKARSTEYPSLKEISEITSKAKSLSIK